jgi:hypothetical protein
MTLRRDVGFAVGFGRGAFTVVNVYAAMATTPGLLAAVGVALATERN